MATAASEGTGGRTFGEDELKAIVAELVGTFLFVFVGAGCIVTANYAHVSSQLTILIAAFGNGLGLGIAITCVAHVSGGNLNPAVTISLWVSQRIDSLKAVCYIAAQLVGAILAALTLKAIYSYFYWAPVHLGGPSLGPGVTFGTGVLIEAILTFFLVFAVFGTMVDPRALPIGGIGVGIVVVVDVLMGGPLTGAAMNPARAFGPEVAANYWTSDDLVYWIGPILGGIIASLIYGYFLMPQAEGGFSFSQARSSGNGGDSEVLVVEEVEVSESE